MSDHSPLIQPNIEIAIQCSNFQCPLKGMKRVKLGTAIVRANHLKPAIMAHSKLDFWYSYSNF